MPLHVMLFLILAVSGLVMVGLAVAFPHRRLVPYRIHESIPHKIRGARLLRSVALNSLVSSGLVFIVIYGARPWLLHERDTSILWMVVQAAAILLVYDFLYYFLHRYVFHQWSRFRGIHVVHHKAKHPTALHSLFLHPLEMVAGLSLLMVSVALVGPVHVYTFGMAFLVYSLLNVLIHAGIDFPFPLRAIGFMARKHDRHHRSMQAGNFASITPIFDILFGTAE